MDRTTQLAHLQDDSAALLAACRADPTAPVANCPGWTRSDLLAHVAAVHGWVRAQLASGPGERVRFSAVTLPEGAALPEWFEAGASELVEQLATMDLSATWPTWAGSQPGTFFPRRMAQETAVHRRDADPYPFDSLLGVDGVDEFLELFAPRIPAERFDGQTGSLHLHATDSDGEWLVAVTPDGVRFEHGHAKGDAALRGAAGDLLMWAWNRAPVDDRFEVFGDSSLLDLWRRAVTF